MIIVTLALLGLCFGSFVNALVWRMHEQSKKPKDRVASTEKLSLTKGRSMCPNCQHELKTIDLIPVISWLGLGGKCRYCKKSISWQYPLVELGTSLFFVISYIFWPDDLTGWGVVYFALWLVCLVGFMALVIYDLRWMLLPNKIVFSLYWVVGAMVLIQGLQQGSLEPLWRALVGVLIGGGLFYLLFQLSDGKWIGGGDVKLGFLLGAIVGGPSQALLLLFIASLLGSLVSIPLIVSKRANKGTRIPFGPFLILATVIVQLWGEQIIQWYIDAFIS
jgi:prepilin signal peptidase PulO-like enzyme (type II secretory pathway)